MGGGGATFLGAVSFQKSGEKSCLLKESNQVRGEQGGTPAKLTSDENGVHKEPHGGSKGGCNGTKAFCLWGEGGGEEKKNGRALKS